MRDVMELKHNEICQTVIHARPGANLSYCLQEAVVLAASEWRNVRLIHNEKSYTVRCNDLLGAIKPDIMEGK